MNVSAATAASGKVSSRLPNSITVFSEVCPAECAATTLVWVHCGQSGQPSPEELSRTAAPVQTRTAFAITEASASPRTESRGRTQHRGGETSDNGAGTGVRCRHGNRAVHSLLLNFVRARYRAARNSPPVTVSGVRP